MTTTPRHQSAGPKSRQLRILQLTFAGAAAIAVCALVDAARPDSTATVLGSGPVHLIDQVHLVDQAFPQTPPGLGGGGFAADDASDQAQQQAQQQEQQAIQQMDEELNEAAQQQFEQGMLQAQMAEQQANNP